MLHLNTDTRELKRESLREEIGFGQVRDVENEQEIIDWEFEIQTMSLGIRTRICYENVCRAERTGGDKLL
jgi:hypothetical protein